METHTLAFPMFSLGWDLEGWILPNFNIAKLCQSILRISSASSLHHQCIISTSLVTWSYPLGASGMSSLRYNRLTHSALRVYFRGTLPLWMQGGGGDVVFHFKTDATDVIKGGSSPANIMHCWISYLGPLQTKHTLSNGLYLEWYNTSKLYKLQINTFLLKAT